MIFEDNTKMEPGKWRQSFISLSKPGYSLVIARGDVSAAEVIQVEEGYDLVNVMIYLKGGVQVEWGPETLKEAEDTLKILFGHEKPEDGTVEKELEGLE